MWLILIAMALSATVWVAEMKRSRILVREELPIRVDASLEINSNSAGISRLLE